MRASMIDQAMRRLERHFGPLSPAVKSAAFHLWWNVTTPNPGSRTAASMLRVPTAAALADGVATLAREQSARGIRTVTGRSCSKALTAAFARLCESGGRR